MKNSFRRSANRIRRSARVLARRGRAEGVAAAKTWNTTMLADAEERNGTRWGRGLAVLVPTAVAAAMLAPEVPRTSFSSVEADATVLPATSSMTWA